MLRARTGSFAMVLAASVPLKKSQQTVVIQMEERRLKYSVEAASPVPVESEALTPESRQTPPVLTRRKQATGALADAVASVVMKNPALVQERAEPARVVLLLRAALVRLE